MEIGKMNRKQSLREKLPVFIGGDEKKFGPEIIYSYKLFSD